MSWNDAWTTLNSSGRLEERPQQRLLAEHVFSVTENGGTLVGEAGTGTGKSFAYLIPLIWRVRHKERGVVSTETTALQDQLVDKDLPFLLEKFGGFTFRSLKGRSHYLCYNRAPTSHGVVLRLRNRDLGDGERRDVERVLGYRLEDDDWDELSGTTEFCGQNKCVGDKCYSTRARALAVKADILVTNHAMLRTHAEMTDMDNGVSDGVLGDFKHLVVDEAHTLENVLVDGWAEQLSPYERHKAMDAVWDGLNAAYLSSEVPHVQQAEKLMLDAFASCVTLNTRLFKQRAGVLPEEYLWKRENFPFGEVYLSGMQAPEVVTALEEYELQGPGRLKAAAEIFERVGKILKTEHETAQKGSKRKIGKAVTACRTLSRVTGMASEALETRDGIVKRYGVPYAVIGHGMKAWKGDYDVMVRCVPLDVSARARRAIWDDPKSVTLVSATLSDDAPGDFRYTLASLGLDGDENLTALCVSSPFDYAAQQLVYLTPEQDTEVEVVGARFSLDELFKVLWATKGRALVLFTARSELDYAAEELVRRDFDHHVLVQEHRANKQVLVDQFTRDTSSVLLATKSFFTGVDFPGETCSAVILCKYPLPQFNTLCRAQIAWWRGRGFPNWYERQGTLIARQAVGRLIRTEKDRGVIALLDQRKGMHEKIVQACAGSYVTQDLGDVERWLTN